MPKWRLDKAQTQLDGTRHAESKVAHDFATLQQSLEDGLAHSKSLETAKTGKAEFATALEQRESRSREGLEGVSSLAHLRLETSSQVASEHTTPRRPSQRTSRRWQTQRRCSNRRHVAEGQTWSLFQETSRDGFQTTIDLQGFRVATLVRLLAERTLRRAFLARFAHLRNRKVQCWHW